jgi:hypothetical protein
MPGPRHRHRLNNTLSTSGLVDSRPPARATIYGPESACWSIWRRNKEGREGGKAVNREQGATGPNLFEADSASQLSC